MQAHAPLTINSPFSIINPGAATVGVFYLVVFLVGMYTLIATYHWMKFGHRSAAAIPAITVHVFVTLALIGFAATGLP